MHISHSDKRIIVPSYSEYNKKIKLSDKVLAYYNGNTWNIIDIEILSRYPLIHDKYITYIDDKVYETDITVVFCPLTYFSAVYEGKFILDSETNNSIVIKDNKTKEGNYHKLNIITGKYYKGAKEIKRWCCHVNSLRYIIGNFIHCQFVIYKENIKLDKIVSQLDDRIKMTTFDPMTIVYLIQYNNSNTNNKNASIIVGNDASKREVNDREIDENGIEEYFNTFQHEIVKRNGFVSSIYWYAWSLFFPKAKIILLN